jgi:hypothetical protein
MPKKSNSRPLPAWPGAGCDDQVKRGSSIDSSNKTKQSTQVDIRSQLHGKLVRVLDALGATEVEIWSRRDSRRFLVTLIDEGDDA